MALLVVRVMSRDVLRDVRDDRVLSFKPTQCFFCRVRILVVVKANMDEKASRCLFNGGI